MYSVVRRAIERQAALCSWHCHVRKMWRPSRCPPKTRTLEFGNTARSKADQAALFYRESSSFRRGIRSKRSAANSTSFNDSDGRPTLKQGIPGTTIFDGVQAQRGFALNRMCFSFNGAENRAAFLADEEAYCDRYGLTDEQRTAVKARNVLPIIEAGGNVYFLPKPPCLICLHLPDICAQTTGMSVDAFKAKLRDAGR